MLYTNFFFIYQEHKYNTKAGNGPTFVYNTDVQYGRLSAKIKAPSVGGTVTALIFKSTDKDEIDYELIASRKTNYYWGQKVEQGKNDKKFDQSISDDYHVYTIDWSPKSIKWSVDGEVIREQTKEATVKEGEARYPTSPSQIQIGLWDGSDAAGTAAWAQGPIEWNEDTISAYIKDVTVTCPY
ncbi:concanavalin A-like lectin/glucanase domain-containing protein [Chlamydoabsidia padenii]|nr:concanavalin A-like lectin/glucanase domain-containing protein [Chlamydoabsidia padenii]